MASANNRIRRSEFLVQQGQVVLFLAALVLQGLFLLSGQFLRGEQLRAYLAVNLRGQVRMLPSLLMPSP